MEFRFWYPYTKFIGAQPHSLMSAASLALWHCKGRGEELNRKLKSLPSDPFQKKFADSSINKNEYMRWVNILNKASQRKLNKFFS